MANGFFAGGNGTAAAPFLIEDAADFDAIRKNVSACYRLVNHINLGVSPYNFGKGWNPIDGFTGQLDGAGFGIFNLYINRPEEDNVGMFRTMRLTTAQVRSFFIYNAKVVGRTNVGAVLGYGDIANGVDQKTHYMGLQSISVDNSFVSGVSNTGGIIGYFQGTIYKNKDFISVGYDTWSISIFQYLYFSGEIFSKNKNGGIMGTGVVFSGWDRGIHYQKIHLDFCFFVLRNMKPLAGTDPITGSVTVVVGGYGVGHETAFLHTTERCFYYCDSIPSSTFATKITQADLSNTNFDKFNVLKDTQQYRFNYNKMPQFIWINRNFYYVKVQGKYYTYDANKQEFIYKYREKDLPKTAELYKNAFDYVGTIPVIAWKKLRDDLGLTPSGSFDLLTINPYAESVVSGVKQCVMKLDEETAGRGDYILRLKVDVKELDRVLGIYA